MTTPDELKAYRLAQWEKGEVLIGAAVSGLTCTGCNTPVKVRLLDNAGVYCFACYVNSKCCIIPGCLEPGITRWRLGGLCREHWQRNEDEGVDPREFALFVAKSASISSRSHDGCSAARSEEPTKPATPDKPCRGMIHSFAPGARVCQCGEKHVKAPAWKNYGSIV